MKVQKSIRKKLTDKINCNYKIFFSNIIFEPKLLFLEVNSFIFQKEVNSFKRKIYSFIPSHLFSKSTYFFLKFSQFSKLIQENCDLKLGNAKRAHKNLIHSPSLSTWTSHPSTTIGQTCMISLMFLVTPLHYKSLVPIPVLIQILENIVLIGFAEWELASSLTGFCPFSPIGFCYFNFVLLQFCG